VECTEDRTIPISSQRRMIAMSPGATVVTLDADHSPFLCASTRRSMSRPLRTNVLGRVRMGDRFDVLMDDRAFVEVGGDIVRGRADHLHAARVRLVIGLGALEAGQEAVVDVDAAPGQEAGRSSDRICM
jgi:hypothetical protein